MTPYNMVELFTNVIDFQMWDGRSEEWRSVDCPLPFATAYLQRTRHWRLRQLTAIITAPTLRPRRVDPRDTWLRPADRNSL